MPEFGSFNSLRFSFAPPVSRKSTLIPVSPRQYALIAGAENVVMLTLRRGRDCDLRRWGWNEIRHSKPGENGDTQYRRRYLEDVPTCNTQHERFRSPTR